MEDIWSAVKDLSTREVDAGLLDFGYSPSELEAWPAELLAYPGRTRPGLAGARPLRALFVADDGPASGAIGLMLKIEGLHLFTADRGEDGIDLGKLYDYDIILLDLDISDMSGIDVLRVLRLAGVRTPVLILSDREVTEDEVRGLDFGADDFMLKPFHKDELVARVHAIIRRSLGPSRSIVTGRLTVNLGTGTADVGGRPVHLTRKEFQLLELLSLHKGRALTREMFLHHLYRGKDEPEPEIIDVFISKLRKKLASADSGGGNYIATVIGEGYTLVEPGHGDAIYKIA
jgi:two-component system cell cycle response regulator CtrA